MLRLTMFVTVWLFSLTALAEPVTLTPYSAVYAANYKGMKLEATRTLKPLGEHRYQVSSIGKHFVGHINEQSEFTLLDNNTIQPHSYQMDRRIFGVGKSEATAFNWQQMNAHYQSNKKERDVVLQGDELDWLGYQVQLAIDLKAGKQCVDYRIVRRGKIKEYRFIVDSEELIETPSGTIKTVKLRQERKNKNRQTTIWLAPEYDYLLVKLHQVEKNGDEYELFLKEANFPTQDSLVTEDLADKASLASEQAPETAKAVNKTP